MLPRLLTFFALFLALSRLSAAPDDDQAAFRVEAEAMKRDAERRFLEAARTAVSGSEKDRLEAIETLGLEPIDPRAISLLCYLVQDPSVPVKRAAVLSMGYIAPQRFSRDLAVYICHYLEAEVHRLEAKDLPQNDEAFLLLGACVWTLHELYVYYPLSSQWDLSEFERHDYLFMLRIIGGKYDKGAAYRDLFESMLKSLGNAEGMKLYLPYIPEITANLPAADECAILVFLRDQGPEHFNEDMSSLFHRWLQGNMPFLNDVAAKARKIGKNNDPEVLQTMQEALEIIENIKAEAR